MAKRQQKRRRGVRRPAAEVLRRDRAWPVRKGVAAQLRRRAEAGDKLAAAALADAERHDNTIVNALAALIDR